MEWRGDLVGRLGRVEGEETRSCNPTTKKNNKHERPTSMSANQSAPNSGAGKGTEANGPQGRGGNQSSWGATTGFDTLRAIGAAMMTINGQLNSGDGETTKRIIRELMTRAAAHGGAGTQSAGIKFAWEQAKAMAKVWRPAVRMAMRDTTPGAHAETMIDLVFDLGVREALAAGTLDQSEIDALTEFGGALGLVMGKAWELADNGTGDEEAWHTRLKSLALAMAAAQVNFVPPKKSIFD